MTEYDLDREFEPRPRKWFDAIYDFAGRMPWWFFMLSPLALMMLGGLAIKLAGVFQVGLIFFGLAAFYMPVFIVGGLAVEYLKNTSDTEWNELQFATWKERRQRKAAQT